MEHAYVLCLKFGEIPKWIGHTENVLVWIIQNQIKILALFLFYVAEQSSIFPPFTFNVIPISTLFMIIV